MGAVCPVCGKGFPSREGLRRHLIHEHVKPKINAGGGINLRCPCGYTEGDGKVKWVEDHLVDNSDDPVHVALFMSGEELEAYRI